ncbi:MAG: hypothetical protein ACI9JR_000157 [Gammaproteobacteria bacterium]|jgi:hypothetical protein
MALVVAIATVFGSFVPAEFRLDEMRAVSAILGFLLGVGLPLLGKYLANSASIIGVVELIEEADGLVLKTSGTFGSEVF